MSQARAVNHYPHHIGDYAKDTRHLTLMQHGAYRLLMDHVYATEKPLPADRRQQYAICAARSRAERIAVDYVVDNFFPQGMNKRAAEELAKYQDKAAKARDSAHTRWGSERIAKAQRTQSDRNADGMLTSNQEPVTSNQPAVGLGSSEDLSKKAFEKVDSKTKAAIQNPAWLFNFDHAKMHARALGIVIAGKTHQELKDAIRTRLEQPDTQQQQPKFAQSQ